MEIEKPIIFSTAMVQAILEGRKSQTRRIVKGTALQWLDDSGFTPEFVASPYNDLCPYGQSGDALWVKETFYAYGHWTKVTDTETGKVKWSFQDLTISEGYSYQYVAWVDFGKQSTISTGRGSIGWYKRPAIFMPRVAARIFLKVENVRVDRLQDITEQDAMNEGANPMLFHLNIHEQIDSSHVFYDHAPAKFRTGFEYLWNKINGTRATWESNPWVWVVEFSRIENYGK